MNNFIVPIILLALYATFGYFRGKKKNSWISGWVSSELERVLAPADTNYVNIGGCIGYNFTYSLKKNFREASGTIIMLPRHSVFYFPISLLTTKHDRLYLNIKADGKLAGEGHIISHRYYRSAKSLIDDFDTFRKATYTVRGESFTILWRVEGLDEKLKKFLDSIENSKHIRHFCCHAENRNFFFFVKPVKEELAALLSSAVPKLSLFYEKGWKSDEQQ